MGAILLGVAAIIAACGTVAVQFAGISEDRRARRRLELSVAAVARTTAATATGIASVASKVDTNTEVTEAIHNEVASVNGITATELAERAEGRRIQEIPEIVRTPSEQGYVDRLVSGGRDM